MTTTTTTHITNTDIKAFASRRINLKREEIDQGRERVRFLRERLEMHIDENPGFELIKMLHAGSVAKGTGLADLNDMDVAVYVAAESVGDDDLVLWMTERLKEVYGATIASDAIQPGRNCPCITFANGFSVDVVPVLDEGDGDGKGYLVSKHTGERLLTSIPLHLEFIRKRKAQHPENLAQVIRYLKWWIRQHQQVDETFKFKSFMAELILAHLADNGMNFSDHTEALTEIFEYIVDTGLKDQVSFTDHYTASQVTQDAHAAMSVIDPVNADNNVAVHYTDFDRQRIVAAAEEALDAITEAGFATTKAQAVACWQVILGTTFKG